jgi:hypothetical protein
VYFEPLAVPVSVTVLRESVRRPIDVFAPPTVANIDV